jgi:hypothetical protein
VSKTFCQFRQNAGAGNSVKKGVTDAMMSTEGKRHALATIVEVACVAVMPAN